ncbi:MAG: hypothetical protein P4L50_03280 [Anaerolineaceae bacterium]|nr:hypothetical protein [Anaerolineaceae bacterium]
MKSKTFANLLIITMIVLILTVPLMGFQVVQPGAIVSTAPVYQVAQPVLPAPTPSDLFAQFGSLVGYAALVAAIINIGKKVGVVKDGNAQFISTILNLIGLVGLLLLRVFKPDLDIAGLDAAAGQIAVGALVVFGYLVQLAGSKFTHFVLKGTPLIGKSFTLSAPAYKSYTSPGPLK